MENDVDLSGVNPAHWPEIRRRVAILDEFVKIKRAPREVRETYAERMGITASHFSVLACIWRKNRSAAALPGAGTRIGRKLRRQLPARSIEIVSAAITYLGIGVRRMNLLAEVSRRCDAEGAILPSPGTITNMLADARAQATNNFGGEPEILIGECTVKLPASADGHPVMPRMLVAVMLPQRIIVAASISCNPEITPSLELLMEQLRTRSTPDGKVLQIRAPHLNAAQRQSIGARPLYNTPARMPALAAVLSTRLGLLGLVFKTLSMKDASSLAAPRSASSLEERDIIRAITDAIEAHNALCQPLPDAGFALPTRAYT